MAWYNHIKNSLLEERKQDERDIKLLAWPWNYPFAAAASHPQPGQLSTVTQVCSPFLMKWPSNRHAVTMWGSFNHSFPWRKELSDCMYISYCFSLSLSFSFLSSFPSFFSPFILQALMPLWYGVADMVRDGEVGIWGIWWVAEKGRKDLFLMIWDNKKMTKFWFYSFHSTAFNQGDRYKAKQTSKQKQTKKPINGQSNSILWVHRMCQDS